MHFVIISHGQFKELQGYYSWPIVLGAGYGFLRLVADALRFTARFGFMRRAVEREQAKRAAKLATAATPPADRG